MVIQIVVLAFVVVGGTCGLLIPVILYIFQLHSWSWPYAALLGSMLASTDAVAIVAVMKTSASHLLDSVVLLCWFQGTSMFPDKVCSLEFHLFSQHSTLQQ